MKGGKHLLLLAVLLLLERSQQKPQVSMSPELIKIFSGDLFYLKCGDSSSGGPVKWYFNNNPSPLTTSRYKVAVANPSHSGKYQCETSGERSDPFDLVVRAYEPSASLTIKTGHPVMETGGSVILSLHHEDGLQGWMCWVHRGDNVRKIKLRSANENQLDFQPKQLIVPETTFWCHHKDKNIRSNQITVRTSEKRVSLEMYPLPAIAGESLTLRCLTWHTDLISRVVFYKDNKSLLDGSSNTYNISSVAERDAGSYRCHASFSYIAKPAGLPYEVDSDAQDVLVQEHPMEAALTEGMYCSCERCVSDTHSHWYMKSGESWDYVDSTDRYLSPQRSGTYACRRVWSGGRSSMSNALDFDYESQSNASLLVIFVLIILLLVVIVAVVGIFIWRKKRSETGAIYEDMPLRSRDDPDAPNRRKDEEEGGYEPLKKREMKGGEYETLEHAAGGEGGYEALKKEPGKEGVYHTLGGEGAGKDNKDKELEIITEKK